MWNCQKGLRRLTSWIRNLKNVWNAAATRSERKIDRTKKFLISSLIWLHVRAIFMCLSLPVDYSNSPRGQFSCVGAIKFDGLLLNFHANNSSLILLLSFSFSNQLSQLLPRHQSAFNIHIHTHTSNLMSKRCEAKAKDSNGIKGKLLSAFYFTIPP